MATSAETADKKASRFWLYAFIIILLAWAITITVLFALGPDPIFLSVDSGDFSDTPSAVLFDAPDQSSNKWSYVPSTGILTANTTIMNYKGQYLLNLVANNPLDFTGDVTVGLYKDPFGTPTLITGSDMTHTYTFLAESFAFQKSFNTVTLASGETIALLVTTTAPNLTVNVTSGFLRIAPQSD